MNADDDTTPPVPPPVAETAETGATTHFGAEEIPEGEKAGRVHGVFSSVAARYDLMNDLMSGVFHRVWKDAMVSYLAPPKAPRSAWRLLDVAGGTGDIATRVVRKSDEAVTAVVCDINESMLSVGRDRAAKAGLEDLITFCQGNAEELPFPDRSFDAYTIAFGIRNVPDIPKALREAHRVLKRGGRFLCLEFSDVDVPGLDKVYDAFSFIAIPPFG